MARNNLLCADVPLRNYSLLTSHQHIKGYFVPSRLMNMNIENNYALNTFVTLRFCLDAQEMFYGM